MDIKKEWIGYQHKIGQNRSCTTVEAEMIAPETQPDIARILQTEAYACVTGSEVQANRVLVYGTVHFCVLYCSAENEPKRLTHKASFTDVVEVKGALQGMTAVVNSTVVRVEHRLLNSRKAAVKAVTELSVCVLEPREQEVICGLAAEGVEQKCANLSFVRNCGVHQKCFSVKEQAEIANEHPPVLEILRTDGKINNVNRKIISGKVIVKADLDVIILYTSAENLLPCSVAVSLPFTEILEIEDVAEDGIFLQNLTVKSIESTVSVDERGAMRLVDLDCLVCSEAKILQPTALSVLADCYGTDKTVEMVQDTVLLDQYVGSMQGQIGIKGQIDLQETQKPAQVYAVNATPVTDAVVQQDNQMLVRGKVLVDLLYITEEAGEPLGHAAQAFPFEFGFDCQAENAFAEFYTAVGGLSYTRNGDYAVDIRGNISIEGVMLTHMAVPMVRAVSVSEPQQPTDRASVTVCFAKEGETLWDIAKRYNTSVQAIATANDIEKSADICGKRLIVPKCRG